MLEEQIYQFTAPLWLYQGKAAWHFISVPVEPATQIRFLTAGTKRGWGSVRVAVTIGQTNWQTSIFPDRKTGTYLLPVKADIRNRENLSVDDAVDVLLRLID